MRTDRRTDRLMDMTKLMNVFRNNENAPKKDQEMHIFWSHICNGMRNKFPHLPLLFFFCNICIILINHIKLLRIFCLAGSKDHRHLCFINKCNVFRPIPVAAQSKAWVCGRSLPGIAGSNSAGGRETLSLVSVVCSQVEVSSLG
jgi:hypothetical protein